MLFKSPLLVLLASWSLMVPAENALQSERQGLEQGVASDPCIDACDSKGMASLKDCLKIECNSSLDPSGTSPPNDKPFTAGSDKDTMTLCESNCYEKNNPMMTSCYDACMREAPHPKTQNPAAKL